MTMSKTKLEELGEQIMAEIKENKKWNERAVTNEMIDRKLDVMLELLHDTRDRVIKLEKRMDEVEKQVQIVKDILNDHTVRLRRLESRMDKLETRMDSLET
jgi:archaellum component FlaC